MLLIAYARRIAIDGMQHATVSTTLLLITSLLVLCCTEQAKKEPKESPVQASSENKLKMNEFLEYKGWRFELVKVESTKDKLIINVPLSPYEEVRPKGSFLLVTLYGRKGDGAKIEITKASLHDKNGQSFPPIAAGVPGEDQATDGFIFLRRIVLIESGIVQLAFERPKEARDLKLKLMDDSPQIDLSAPEGEKVQ